jgi:sodium/hydrogen antiporter
MSYLAWMTVAGVLLLTMALSSAYVRRLPVSTAIIYLATGIALGPIGFHALRIDVRDEVGWFERLTEAAVIVSLFISGVKLRLPFRAPPWRSAFRLAGPLMLLCIGGVAAFCHLALEMPAGAALLTGSILAPTDPVLASAVAVESASDRDHLRYGLTGEAGLNDGAAFPFVVLSLAWLKEGGPGSWLAGWAVHRLLWAVPAGLALGYVLGRTLGRLAVHVRSRERDTGAPSDFLALALIALAYVAAERVGAWGFLSVFAAGIGLRRAERKVVMDSPHPDAPMSHAISHPPAEEVVGPNVSADAFENPSVAAGRLLSEVLSFGDTTERILEVMLVLLVGVALAEHWDVRALGVAVALIVVVRPLAAQLVLVGTPTTRPQRWLMGWFGVRGIGSLYYLSFALREGLPARAAADVSALTVSVVAISVVVHGITAQPLLGWYARSLRRA